MRAIFLRPPPPTALERVLGRRRARLLRRRLGLVAVGLGFTLLRPKPRHPAVASVVLLGLLVLTAASLRFVLWLA